MKYRVGHGYDVHRLEAGRRLILGGVEIEHERGLAGHSDADVLTHAVIDALLGAAGLGDIGEHFPDADGQYKDISSLVLLERAVKLVERDFNIVNVDCTVVAEQPKLAQYKPEMRDKLSKIMHIYKDDVNIKAKTEERLGLAGSGIAAHAVCIVEKRGGKFAWL